MITADKAEIAKILRVKDPDDFARNWPVIEICLESLGCGSTNSQIGAMATVAVETAYTFRPIKERSPHGVNREAYFEAMYGPDTRRGKILGNTQAGDGAKFAGAGFIQSTGRFNARRDGEALGIDLIANPELRDDVNVSASQFALFWKRENLAHLADLEKWIELRKRVNGGTNNLKEFLAIVYQLKQAVTRELLRTQNV
jgi:hypothetical protein